MGDPLTESMAASSAVASLALLFFIFRLWIRIRIQRVGWDDIWAALAFVCGTMNVVSAWIYIIQLDGESSTISMWIYMFTFTCLAWSVRVSIIFSIIRVIPARERLHKYGLAIVAFFLLVCFAFLAQDAIQCVFTYQAFQPADSIETYFLCSISRSSKISELAVGCAADIVAVAFPLYVLHTAKLQSRVHRLLRLLFSTSLVVSITCSLRTACQLVPELVVWSIVITNFQIAICLITCNILVIATYLYRALGYQGHDSTSDTSDKDSAVEKDELATSSSTRQPMSLTTIEHLSSVQSGDSRSIASDKTETVPKAVSATDSRC